MYKILFCIANNIDNITTALKSYVDHKDYKFQIEHISDYSDLITYKNFNLLDCIVLQEFFNAEIPITIEYLKKLASFKNLRVVCIFDELKRKSYANELFENGLFDCFFGDDASLLSLDGLVEIISNGRRYIEAKKYYNLNDRTESISLKNNIIKELMNISKLYKNDEELLIEEFNIITENLSDLEIKALSLQLPANYIESFLLVPKFYEQYQTLKNTIINAEKSKKIIDLDKASKSELKLIPVNSKNIGVVSLSSGAGASFFCINFAKALSEFMKVSVIEMPLLKPYMYYYLGLNALCAEGLVDFTSYAHLINENKALTNNYYIHTKNNDIYWIVSDASKCQIKEWDFTKMMRLLYMPKPSSMNIVDLGDKLFDDSIINIIEQFDMIIVLIDPMVPNLINSFPFLEKIKVLKEKSVHVEYIVNKYSKGIDNSDLLDFLDIKPLAYLPYINPKNIYKSVYNAEIPYNTSEVRTELFPEFKELIKIIVPKEIYNQKFNKKIFKIK